MSRIGNLPIPIVDGVTVEIGAQSLKIIGPKGELSTPVPEGISFGLANGELVASRKNEVKQTKAFHGLARALAANAVTGVSAGFKIELEIVGIGYRAAMQGSKLVLQVGYSHAVEFAAPEGVQLSTPNQTAIEVRGIDKQKVGEAAARIRRVRPPDSYKGKGIRYRGEVVRRKVGKTAVSAI